LAYPAETAGRLMDSTISTFRRDATAGAALNQLRSDGMRTARSLFLVDDSQRLTGLVPLAEVALASPDSELGALERPIVAVVRPVDPLEVVADAFSEGNVLDLPVIDLDGVFLGAVTHDDLAHTIQEDATLSMQTMVGASKEERALSSPLFAVRKRMPWLQINLVTAFMAAAVVGVFEQTIAQVTALAVLLPVVAGQSGNTGAQALAITMRGLALREITTRQWARVMRKEVAAGFLNGLAIALTCGLGVYAWSQSIGLVAVICISMVLAMVSAGFAGALSPIVLTRLGQDPASSSSIILTTITDIAGFFSFLGIATLLIQYL
jgi:magnesium transporter